jgi:APA family basic amino acid/polyamine antiporter
MSFWTRRKSLDALAHIGSDRQLKKTLGWQHLIALGIGAVIGTGIFVLVGRGSDYAGPAVILAFALAGALSVCAALAYAEMATLLPAAGSAYTYTYTVLGEGLAWIVGWSLILEYGVTCGAVASGWSGYMVGLVNSLGVHIPDALATGPAGGGIINLPAVLIVVAVTALLARGTKESASVNVVLVAIKLMALAMFVYFTLQVIHPGNFEPFSPYGFPSHVDADGHTRGVMAAAAIIFFAYLGFDAVSTAAEEVKNPSRDLKIGILGSLFICTAIYILISYCAVGSWDFHEFEGSREPLALILRNLDHPTAALLIGAAAIIALPSVILVMMYGQTRVLFVMSRDGLLPVRLSKLSGGNQTPVFVTVLVGGFVAAIAGFFRLDEIAELSNAGTLLAFLLVAVCVLVLRVRRPDLERKFRCPWVWMVAPIAVAGSLYFIVSLPNLTILRFCGWNVIGVMVYLAYGRTRATLAQGEK